jgi:hypothetical protein
MAKLPIKPKLCFVVGPIGGNDSDDRVHADWLLEGIIQPVFDEHFPEFRVERADKMSDPGRIDEQIITALLSAELVIADITNLNPNAFYEIGIRHAIQKPTIHMHLEGQKIPFDISSFRSIEFSRKRPKDLGAARETLTEFVRTATAEDYVVDNPVTFSRGKVEFDKTATPSEKIIQDQLSDISRRLGAIEDARPDFSVVLGNPPHLMPSGGRYVFHGDIKSSNRSLVRLVIGFADDTSRDQIQDFARLLSVGGLFSTVYNAVAETGRAVLTVDADEATPDKIKGLTKIAKNQGLNITSIMHG